MSASPPGPSRRGRRNQRCSAPRLPARGQASVELALVLPLLLVLLLVLVQVGLLVRDQILVVHAAREAAREAAVDPSPEAAQRAAAASSGLHQERLHLSITGRGQPGSRVRVVARYRSALAVPLLGSAIKEVELEATATMRVER